MDAKNLQLIWGGYLYLITGSIAGATIFISIPIWNCIPEYEPADAEFYNEEKGPNDEVE